MHEYNKIDAVRSGDIRALAEGKTLAHVKHRFNNPIPSTPAMALGTVVHALVSGHLEDFVQMKLDGRTKAGKEERKEARENFPHAVMINTSDYEVALAMANSVLSNPAARSIIDESIKEGSFMWEQEGVMFKVRPDYVNDTQRVVSDLKTASDASYQGFIRAVRYGFYDLQAYHQLRGVAVLDDEKADYSFRWIVVDKEPPYPCTVYPFIFSERTIKKWNKYAGYLRTAHLRGEWPGYGNFGTEINEEDLG